VERRAVNPWRWQDQFSFVQANEIAGAQRVLLVSGQASVDADGQLLHPGDFTAQLQQALDNIETVLQEANYRLGDVVRLNYYTTDVDAFLSAPSQDLLAERFAAAGCHPAATLLGIARLGDPAWLIEIDATAIR
jgi:enamine deaminase RidA (YjgF/YER057c/UK114 family)